MKQRSLGTTQVLRRSGEGLKTGSANKSMMPMLLVWEAPLENTALDQVTGGFSLLGLGRQGCAAGLGHVALAGTWSGVLETPASFWPPAGHGESSSPWRESSIGFPGQRPVGELPVEGSSGQIVSGGAPLRERGKPNWAEGDAAQNVVTGEGMSQAPLERGWLF